MTRWYTEKKTEHYYKEAKRTGYRARSAFKLQQIQEKFSLIQKGDTVVDLGAAPGGWCQVASEFVGSMGKVVGVDLSSIKPLENVQFIRGDIANSVTVESIYQLVKEKGADVVISDMSPDISGHYSTDHARSIWLCDQAIAVARRILNHNGHFVCKIFDGEETKRFIDDVKQSFSYVKIYSPDASRKSSSEIYLIAKSFKK